MTPRERELLTGIGNCYEACHEGFEETVGMVARSRDRSIDEVKETLRSISERYGNDPDFLRLRERFPATFPV